MMVDARISVTTRGETLIRAVAKREMRERISECARQRCAAKKAETHVPAATRVAARPLPNPKGVGRRNASPNG